MASQLQFHPDTSADLSPSVAYYDEISQQVGGQFRDALRDPFKAIVERPESFACIHNQQPAAFVQGFSYVIVYEKLDNFMIVLGVFHAASGQLGWITRSI